MWAEAWLPSGNSRCPSRGILNRLRVKADFLAAGRIVVSFGDKMRSVQRSVKVSPTRASDVLGVVANETPLHVGLGHSASNVSQAPNINVQRRTE